MSSEKITINYKEIPEDENYSFRIRVCDIEIKNQTFRLDDDDNFAQLPILNQNKDVRYETVRDIKKIEFQNNLVEDFLELYVEFYNNLGEFQKAKVKYPKEMIAINNLVVYDKDNKEIRQNELRFKPRSQIRV